MYIDPTLTWHTFLGGPGRDQANSLSLDSSGNIYVAGNSNAGWGSPVNAYSGSYDIVVAKLDTAGTLQWHTFLGGSNYDSAQSLSLDSSGNIYVAGNSNASWGTPLNAHSGSTDIVVAKLDTAGILQWHTFLGGADYDSAQSLSLDSNDNLYVAGSSYASWGSPENAHSGNRDIVVAKLDTTGALQWHTFLGGSSHDVAQSLSLDSNDNLYVAGISYVSWGSPLNAHSGGSDIVVAKLDITGTLQWHTFLGGSSYDYAQSLSLDSNDNLYVAGRSDVSWGTPLNAHSGGSDIVVAKLALILPGEINLQGNTQAIANGDAIPSTTDKTDFASVNVNTGNQTHTFTIQNNGSGTLNLTGTPMVAISGTDASDFSVSTQPASSSIVSAGITTFSITFNPSATGLRTATINISNDDSTADPYTFNIQGTGVVPEINLQGNSQDIIDGDISPDTADDTDFASVNVNTGNQAHTFTIQNNGTGTLTLTGTPIVTISGADVSDFTVTTQPASANIAASGNTSFIVTFDPSAAGLRSAIISISNNDSIADPYTFTLQGTGIVSMINLQGNGQDIVNGDTTPSTADDTDFSEVFVSGDSESHTFILQNTGTDTLNLTGTPLVEISGSQADDFSISTEPADNIAPSDSTSFVVTPAQRGYVVPRLVSVMMITLLTRLFFLYKAGEKRL